MRSSQPRSASPLRSLRRRPPSHTLAPCSIAAPSATSHAPSCRRRRALLAWGEFHCASARTIAVQVCAARLDAPVTPQLRPIWCLRPRPRGRRRQGVRAHARACLHAGLRLHQLRAHRRLRLGAGRLAQVPRGGLERREGCSERLELEALRLHRGLVEAEYERGGRIPQRFEPRGSSRHSRAVCGGRAPPCRSRARRRAAPRGCARSRRGSGRARGAPAPSRASARAGRGGRRPRAACPSRRGRARSGENARASCRPAP